MQNPTIARQPLYVILLLILAGEAVFILPFVLARVFRPTFLDVFELTNLELGTCFSVYGIVAFISYLLGGTLADKFKPKILIAVALFLTALGGLVISTYPSYFVLKIVYGYWGFTTIFLFWAAMIKATRVWGGTKSQGLAFGFLDGGRGLVAAAFGSLGVFVFSLLITSEIADAAFSERKEAFRYVILISSAIICTVGVLILLFLKTDASEEIIVQKKTWAETFSNFKVVIKIPSVWLLMIIILCAYVGYKMTDVFSLYAKEVMLYDEIESAKVGTYLLYIRPVIGITIGFLADKTKTSLMMILGFLVMLFGALIFASGVIEPSMSLFFLLSLLITATGVYAFRTLYFAAMQEGHIPLAVTGTAVGIISLIGYTPDIFMGPAMGYLLDNSPGELGHQHVFLMLAAFSGLGLITAFRFYWLDKSIYRTKKKV
ncbi:sugar phosphate permease [Ulvibacter sp. MAR_2010_11]|uniref:MFS transporter n=1 Tax=Ulvibacter sp. MAR_2010_11 TaxID=1250229 RepID=UPI000C2BFE1E|nr:MFS transporter [Ulvibacter sp. MAR_2010_11]PKA84544.1 sugar phosphate permease [Ulvibacter sp. MAR_2010_11]